MANRSCDWLEYEKTNNPNSPLLLTVNFPAPHGPEDAAPSWQTVFNSTRQPINLENYNYVNNEKKHSLLREGSNAIKLYQKGSSRVKASEWIYLIEMYYTFTTPIQPIKRQIDKQMDPETIKFGNMLRRKRLQVEWINYCCGSEEIDFLILDFVIRWWCGE